MGDDTEGMVPHTLTLTLSHSHLEGDVDCIALALACTHILHRTCPREELSVLVEANSHDSVSQVEGLLHPVAVVDVDVDVQHPVQYIIEVC